MTPASDLPPGRTPTKKPEPASGGQNWGWIAIALVVLVSAFYYLPSALDPDPRKEVTYKALVQRVEDGEVEKATINNDNGKITGEFEDGTKFDVKGPRPPTDAQIDLFQEKIASFSFDFDEPSLFAVLFPLLLPVALIIGFWYILTRRAQGQMNGIMSVGRSRAKVYTTERPDTTFSDVAGYTGVKQEITEVVDFLKSPKRFKDIGARIPKGVLLVGPPGTGKTLLARAVAGEAGVPFMSVTGSDFMEMFVGVGASRVRDLFQTARRQAPAIVFIDEIDSIGRKRGAGLGGGHDEREQTLNQMLAEMDGFETTEGIVMMAATNRPDILDPALLRPGRFDRQVVVPLPGLEERLPILQVHTRHKKIAPDVDLETVARGTPGMSGADLANLVNEAALHAVRKGRESVTMEDFDAARDRVLMGQRREATVLSEKEKRTTALHEGGHAVLAYVLPHSDPVHKVTILPTGLALGVTQQLPIEERHTYWREYIEDTIAVMLGGRCAESLTMASLSSGSSNDLQRATELARRMVTEFGMSDRVGPMAWGTHGHVFLGEDLMQSAREYSDQTARVIDEEVEEILRRQEARAMETLAQHKEGLELVAQALLEKETVDGAEVGRLVDQAFGSPVHEHPTIVPHLTSKSEVGNGNGRAGDKEANSGEAPATKPL